MDFSLCNEEYWRKKQKELAPEYLAELFAEADRILEEPELSVTFKTVPPLTGNPHDYVSLSRYDWPNPDTPDGLPWIKRDGVTNPDYAKYDFFPLVRMCYNTGILTAAARLSGKTVYAEKAGKFLKCWFLQPETAMTPHLNFAQFVPGRPEGSSWGLIDANMFCELLEAAAALPFSSEWTPADRDALQQWFTRYFLWYVGNPLPVKEEKAHTNHATWYDAQFVAIAMFLEQPDLARRQIREKSISRLSVQLLNNGLQPFEVARTLSLSYSVFNLEAWSKLAAYARKLGMELWQLPSDDQATLEQAFHHLLPFLTGEKEWEFLQINPPPHRPARLFTLVNDFLEPVPGPFRELLACVSPAS